MKVNRARIIKFLSLFIIQALTLIVLQALSSGVQINSFASAIGVASAYLLAQTIFWFVFIQFFAQLPAILYPIFTFILSGVFVAITSNWIPGVVIDNWVTGIWITVWLTAVNAVVGGVLSLDEDASFDHKVIRRMVEISGKTTQTEVPGFLFLEIDGLGEQMLRRALQEGHMPTVKSWLDQGMHHITSWETDFTSQTGAMQTGILMGNNDEIPAYRWWDRTERKLIMSGDPRDAVMLEKTLSTGHGLLSDGGASRGNMFSGDASESLLTISTVLNRDRERGPGFYFFLFSPYVIARLLSRFIVDCIKEWWQAWRQRQRKDPYRVSARNPAYALLRGFMSPIMQDLATYMVISDVIRGVPAIYALYAGYDDLSHFAGIHTPEAFEALSETDRYFARIERAMQDAPRPYHIIVLSDHGQTLGKTFENTYQVRLEELVEALMEREGEVYAAQKTHETWDKLSLLLSEAIQEDSRTAELLRSMLQNKRKGDVVQVGPQSEDEKAKAKEVVVLQSGCTGLIYFSNAKNRATYEQIQKFHPELILGLVKHPGIGFVLVKSEVDGSMAIGKKGIHFLDDGKVEGQDPLIPYGPNAARHLLRETNFVNCPDILVNSTYDPLTQEMCGFENQVSHHGGLGGPQNHAFILHPTSLDSGDEPVVTAVGAHRLLRGWRDQVQGSSE